MRRFASKPQPFNLSLASEFSSLSKEKRTVNLIASLKVPGTKPFLPSSNLLEITPQENVERPPIDLVAVLDRSGSMYSSMDLLKQTMRFMVQELSEKDRLGIIEYNDTVSTLFPLSKMTPARKVCFFQLEKI